MDNKDLSRYAPCHLRNICQDFQLPQNNCMSKKSMCFQKSFATKTAILKSDRVIFSQSTLPLFCDPYRNYLITSISTPVSSHCQQCYNTHRLVTHGTMGLCESHDVPWALTSQNVFAGDKHGLEQ